MGANTFSDTVEMKNIDVPRQIRYSKSVINIKTNGKF